jgi:hypothetical protein
MIRVLANQVILVTWKKCESVVIAVMICGPQVINCEKKDEVFLIY